MMIDSASGAEPISEFLGPEAERLAREALAYALESAEDDALSVALAWDGFLTKDGCRQEAVFAEAYELGRVAGAVLAQPYAREGGAPAPLGDPVLCEEPPPLVPPTAETARRHLADWEAGARDSLRWLVEQLGADLAAYDYDPYTCLPALEDFVATVRPEELEEHRAFLHGKLAAYVAEVLIRGRGGHWDVIPDATARTGYAYVVEVRDSDGRPHRVDPFRVVAGHLDPVPQPLLPLLERVEHSIP